MLMSCKSALSLCYEKTYHILYVSVLHIHKSSRSRCASHTCYIVYKSYLPVLPRHIVTERVVVIFHHTVL